MNWIEAQEALRGMQESLMYEGETDVKLVADVEEVPWQLPEVRENVIGLVNKLEMDLRYYENCRDFDPGETWHGFYSDVMTYTKAAGIEFMSTVLLPTNGLKGWEEEKIRCEYCRKLRNFIKMNIAKILTIAPQNQLFCAEGLRTEPVTISGELAIAV